MVAKVKIQIKIVEAETEAELKEKCCLLTDFPWLAHFAFL